MLEDALAAIICWFFTDSADENAPEATRAPRWLRIGLFIALAGGAGVIVWLAAK